MLPSTRQRLQAPLTRPSPWTALAGRAAGTPRSSAPGPSWTGSQIQDSRGPSLGGPRPRPEACLGGPPLASEPRARATGGGTRRLGPSAEAFLARTSAPGFANRLQIPPCGRPPVGLTGSRPGPRDCGSVSVGYLGCEECAGASYRCLPVVPERPPPPPPYRCTAPAGPRPAPAHWLRRARSRLRGPGAAADPLCALSFPRSRSRPLFPAPHSDPALLALAGLAKSAAPSAHTEPRQGPEPKGPALHAAGRGRIQIETPGVTGRMALLARPLR